MACLISLGLDICTDARFSRGPNSKIPKSLQTFWVNWVFVNNSNMVFAGIGSGYVKFSKFVVWAFELLEFNTLLS